MLLEKECSKCYQTKPISKFYTQFSRSTKRRYVNGECKACAKARIRIWSSSNKDRVKKNQAKSLEGRKDRHYLSVKRWRYNHRSTVRFYSAKYKDRSLRATPDWANEFFIREIYDLAQLRTKATGIRWEVDHVVPLQSKLVCGLHVENNLQVIPQSMNRRKSNIVWPDMPGAI